MIQESSEIPRDSVVQGDVCIVGGGMAGIAIALRLQGSGRDVVVLEGGGESPDPDTEALTAGENVGLPYYPLDDARPRLLGGSTNYWAGWCRPIDPGDLTSRSWIPLSGWPMAWESLSGYMEDAKALCEIPGATFDPADYAGATPELYGPPFATGKVTTTLWVGSPPTKFGATYRDDLARDEHTRVILHANVTALATDPAGGRVEAAKVRTLAGNAFEVKAKVFVLCPGAMETTRILLNSRQGSRMGIGNEHDVVGRYFMEHPHVVTGRLKIARTGRAGRDPVAAVDGRLMAGAKARLAMERPEKNLKFAYTLTRAAQEDHELLNWCGHLRTVSYLRGGPEVYHAIKLMVGNLRSIRTLAGQIRKGQLPRGVGKQLGTLARYPDDLVRVLVQQLIRRPREFEVYTQSEQAPNASSRVMLGDERDALGVPRVKLDWRLSDIDKVSILESQAIVSRRLEEAGIGAIEPAPWVSDPSAGWPDTVRGGFHHMGTARMGSDPRTSVVDAETRVHGVDNLYVGDTSVFPTSGYANPLLTGAALALRTADFVKARLAEYGPTEVSRA